MLKDKEKTMPVLSREDILQAEDILIELVDAHEWGGNVFAKGITGKERGKFEASIIINPGQNQKLNMVDMRAMLCSLGLCNEDGEKLFTPADVKALNEKSAAPLDRCFAVIQRLSGLSDDDVEELAEGLQDSPFEGSASDQPGIQA